MMTMTMMSNNNLPSAGRPPRAEAAAPRVITVTSAAATAAVAALLLLGAPCAGGGGSERYDDHEAAAAGLSADVQVVDCYARGGGGGGEVVGPPPPPLCSRPVECPSVTDLELFAGVFKPPTENAAWHLNGCLAQYKKLLTAVNVFFNLPAPPLLNNGNFLSTLERHVREKQWATVQREDEAALLLRHLTQTSVYLAASLDPRLDDECRTRCHEFVNKLREIGALVSPETETVHLKDELERLKKIAEETDFETFRRSEDGSSGTPRRDPQSEFASELASYSVRGAMDSIWEATNAEAFARLVGKFTDPYHPYYVLLDLGRSLKYTCDTKYPTLLQECLSRREEFNGVAVDDDHIRQTAARADFHLLLAGGLYAAQLHRGRRTNSTPDEYLEQWVRKCCDQMQTGAGEVNLVDIERLRDPRNWSHNTLDFLYQKFSTQIAGDVAAAAAKPSPMKKKTKTTTTTKPRNSVTKSQSPSAAQPQRRTQHPSAQPQRQSTRPQQK